MVKTIPYILTQNGKESIELYRDLFGAKEIRRLPFNKEMGPQMGLPDDFNYENSTMHAEIEIGGAKVMLSDNNMGKAGSGNVMIYLELDSQEKIEAINEKVKKKKFKILMPLEKMFWGAWYMMFEDSNGVGWQVGYGEGEVFPSK